MNLSENANEIFRRFFARDQIGRITWTNHLSIK